jgi:hypothetical protein
VDTSCSHLITLIKVSVLIKPQHWGPWGLAWWEALLRAADQQASRDNDAADSTAAKEGIDG